jgi:hypothetical protein
MIEFARNTPPEVANWLRAQLGAMPNDPILIALATDERMSGLWAELEKWQPGALTFVQLAAHFSGPAILSALQKPSEERDWLSWPESPLGIAAEDFAIRLECWPNAATELWGEPIDALVGRLRAFATAAFERAKAKQSAYDYIAEPRQGGRGSREQLAFREALSAAMQRHPLPKEGQDRIIATIASVVFPEYPVDTETIRRHRQRQRRRQKRGAIIRAWDRLKLSGDNSHQ